MVAEWLPLSPGPCREPGATVSAARSAAILAAVSAAMSTAMSTAMSAAIRAGASLAMSTAVSTHTARGRISAYILSLKGVLSRALIRTTSSPAWTASARRVSGVK